MENNNNISIGIKGNTREQYSFATQTGGVPNNDFSNNDLAKKMAIKKNTIISNNKQIAHGNSINGNSGATNSTFTNKINATSSLERRYEKLISEINQGKGKAVTTLGGFLFESNKFASKIDALEFAWEFLEYEEYGYLDTMITLIEDGWQGTFGQLISCAKNI